MFFSVLKFQFQSSILIYSPCFFFFLITLSHRFSDSERCVNVSTCSSNGMSYFYEHSKHNSQVHRSNFLQLSILSNTTFLHHPLLVVNLKRGRWVNPFFGDFCTINFVLFISIPYADLVSNEKKDNQKRNNNNRDIFLLIH